MHKRAILGIQLKGGREASVDRPTPPRWLTVVDELLADPAPLAALPFLDEPAAPRATIAAGRGIDDPQEAADDD